MGTSKTSEKVIWFFVVLLAVAKLLTQEYWEEPLSDIPLNLSQVGESKFIFNVGSDNQYQLALYLDRVMVNGELVCTTSPTITCRKMLKNLNMNWEISSDEGIISSGELKNVDATSVSNDRVGIALGYFFNKSNADIKLTIFNLKDNKTLNKLSPTIAVKVSSVALVNHIIELFILNTVLVILLIIAVVNSCLIRIKKTAK